MIKLTIEQLLELFPGDWDNKSFLLKDGETFPILRNDTARIIFNHIENVFFIDIFNGDFCNSTDIEEVKNFYKKYFKFQNFK